MELRQATIFAKDMDRMVAFYRDGLGRSNTPLKLVFQTTDVGGARNHLLSLGAVMNEVSGRGDCDGLDPEGNVFQIMEVVR